jgi:hypothetical protein
MGFIMRVLLLVMKDCDSMFEKNPELIARIKKKLKGSSWSETLILWDLPDTAENKDRFH